MTIIGHSYSLVKNSAKCAPALPSTQGQFENESTAKYSTLSNATKAHILSRIGILAHILELPNFELWGHEVVPH